MSSRALNVLKFSTVDKNIQYFEYTSITWSDYLNLSSLYAELKPDFNEDSRLILDNQGIF
jgi:hypothetical protein